MAITRYSTHEGAAVFPKSDGEYVRYEDHVAAIEAIRGAKRDGIDATDETAELNFPTR